jgi:hypothetical protein
VTGMTMRIVNDLYVRALKGAAELIFDDFGDARHLAAFPGGCQFLNLDHPTP